MSPPGFGLPLEVTPSSEGQWGALGSPGKTEGPPELQFYICGMRRDLPASQVCREDRRSRARMRVWSSRGGPHAPTSRSHSPRVAPSATLMSRQG